MFEIFKDSAGKWRYRIKGGNGEIMVTSEAYTRDVDAVRGVHDLMELFEKNMMCTMQVSNDPALEK